MRLYGPTNVLSNGNFETGSTGPWYTFTTSGSINLAVTTASPYAGAYTLVASVVAYQGNARYPYVAQRLNNVFYVGRRYACRFNGKSSVARSFVVGADSVSPAENTVLLSTSYEPLEALFAPTIDVTSTFLRFSCGVGSDALLYLDNIEVRGYAQLAPGWDYERVTARNRTDDRTRAGALYTTLNPGGFTRFRLPLSWVSSLDRSIVTSWWKSGAELLYAEDDTFPFSCHNVRIMGLEEPFQTSMEPHYQAYYAGEIVLETV